MRKMKIRIKDQLSQAKNRLPQGSLWRYCCSNKSMREAKQQNNSLQLYTIHDIKTPKSVNVNSCGKITQDNKLIKWQVY